MKHSTWEAKALCAAPGEAPTRSLEVVNVLAVTVEGAARDARVHFLRQAFLDPIVVSVRRIDPPAWVT